MRTTSNESLVVLNNISAFDFTLPDVVICNMEKIMKICANLIILHLIFQCTKYVYNYLQA